MDRNRSLPASVRVDTLRSRALSTARKWVEDSGPEAVKLRELAESLNCGIGSLYYHFANKDELLAAIAIEGFKELGRSMQSAGEQTNELRTRGASTAYLNFMRDNLRLYSLMYSENLVVRDPEVRKVEEQTFLIFKKLLAADGFLEEREVEHVSLMYWAIGRGIASIILDKGASDPDEALAVALSITEGLRLFRHFRFPDELIQEPSEPGSVRTIVLSASGSSGTDE